jgi:hypothetical protein
MQNFPDRGRGDRDAQDQQFAVNAAVPPRAVLAGQAQHHHANRPHRRWASRTLGARDRGVPAGEQVSMPAQHGLRPDQQPNPAPHLAGEPVQQGGEQHPVGPGEPDLLTVQLPLQNGDLMSESQDLHVLGVVTQRQQTQHRQGVRQAEVRQSQQHGEASSPSDPVPAENAIRAGQAACLYSWRMPPRRSRRWISKWIS